MASSEISPRQKAGKIGGQKILLKYGRDYFKTIGQRGGKSNLKNNGRKHMAAIGQIGGMAKKHQERS